MQITKGIRGILGAAAASVCFAFSAPSAATAFQVEFDPIPELFGTAYFDLAAPCLANDGSYDTWDEIANLAAAGCLIDLTSAHVSTTGAGGPFTDYTAVLPFVFFSDLLIVNHQLAGITTFIPIFLDPVDGVNGAAYTLAYNTFGGGLAHVCVPSLSFTVAGDVNFTSCVDGQPQSLQGTVTRIALVPEPGTLALLLGGGLGLWWVRRRRNAGRVS